MSVERWIETDLYNGVYNLNLLLTRMSVERWIETWGLWEMNLLQVLY